MQISNGMEQLELTKKNNWARRTLTLSAPQAVGAFLVVAILSAWIGASFFSVTPAPIYDARAPEEVDLAPLFKAWSLLDENFTPATSTATTSSDEKLWGAIQGLAASYGDDYTVFLPPVQKQIFETQVNGDFQGVGMEIGKRGGILTVIAPIKDTPAYRAGVESGDLILEIDGEPTGDLTVEAAVGKIRGPKGSIVTLTLSRASRRSGEPFEIPVMRDTIVLPTADYELRPDGIFVVQVYMFNANAPRIFAEALTEFERSRANKLIIDLRGNPGGYLEAAVDMVSWFIPAGEVVVTQDYGTKEAGQVYRSSGFGTHFPSARIAVLIDGGSASASEIFAGALRDHNRATLIGQQSFGKGSVQQVFDVTDDTSLKITIARWLTPSGTSISHQGLHPDIEVTIPDDLEEGEDPTLERAVQFLNTGQ